MADKHTEADEVTLHVLAILEGTTVAEQRRRAVIGYARQARQRDESIAQIVSLILASRRERSSGGHNVIQIRGGQRA